MQIDELLARGREIWGDERLTLEEIVIRLGVVTGDLNRQARTHQENGDIDESELKKEMGNIIFSMVRWCDDLGYDPDECLRLAQEAQAWYAKKKRK